MQHANVGAEMTSGIVLGGLNLSWLQRRNKIRDCTGVMPEIIWIPGNRRSGDDTA